MITRITKANADKYRALFNDAVIALQNHNEEGKLVSEYGGEPIISVTSTYEPVVITEKEFIPGIHYIKVGEGENDYEKTALNAVFIPNGEYALLIESSEKITTLEEYFCYIAYLRSINKKFIVLPLEDEENFFHIDANTRIIEVPESFKKNGISVQGDEAAEMLYFKIDRFFDMDDLGEKSVYIEWRLPADPETGEQKHGVSIPYVLDKNMDPDHVIIGWPVRAQLTKNPGKIEFAVRFYTIPEDGPSANKLVYSFSTLPATADIKASLNLDLEKIALDGSALDSESFISDRLENSESKDDTSPDPVTPIWLDVDKQLPMPPLPQAPEKVEDEEALYDTYKVYLTNKETGEEVDGLFIVQAHVSDSGRLSYAWIKRDEEGEIILNYDGGNPKLFVEAAKDENGAYVDAAPDRKYYVKASEDSYPEYLFTAEIATPRAAQLAGETLYECKAQIVMNCSGTNVLGTYQARAVNRLGRKTARAFSSIVLIEGPIEPTITKDLGTDARFGGENLDVTVSVEANVDPHAYVTYELYRSATKEGDYVAQNKITTSNTFTIDGKAYNENEPDADLGDGFYKVEVNTKLNSIIETKMGEPIRITHKAAPVTITNSEPTYTEGGVIGHDINMPLKVNVEIHPSEVGKRTEEDNLIYRWYKYSAPNPEQQKLDLNAAEQGLYEVSSIDEAIGDFITTKELTSSIQLDNTAKNEQGFYFCQVTNKYNGDEEVKCSKFFNVLDTNVVGR